METNPVEEVPAVPTPPPMPNAPVTPPITSSAASATARVLPKPPATVDFAVVRERDRLLTLANVQRMRGQTADARKTLEEVLAVSEAMPPRDVAPTYELLGDLNAADEKWDAALDAYRKAHEIDKLRVGAEKKFAALTLRMSDMKAENRLAEAMLRGENIGELMAGSALASRPGRRNAGIAMILSTVIPGFGQFYNGEFVKGAVLLGLFALGLLYAILSGDLDTLTSKLLGTIVPASVNNGHGQISSHVAGYSSHPLSIFSIFMSLVLVGTWLYSIVDAPFMAAKTSRNDVVTPAIDKTGWEV